jgi:hypothetical protein
VAHVITHRNIGPYLKRLQREPEFKIGKTYRPTGDEWYRTQCRLEFPTGEAAKDGLTSMALIGQRSHSHESLTGKEGFDAQGLEGKVVVWKDLFTALMNLRDLLPERRGRIVLKNPV